MGAILSDDLLELCYARSDDPLEQFLWAGLVKWP